MKRILQIILIISLVQPAWAYRIIRQTESAYELEFVDVSFPNTTVGSLSFKACGSCETQSLRVTEDTQYLLDQNLVSSATFYEFVARVRATPDAAESAGVYVFYDVASHQINRIKLKASLVN